MHPYSSHVRKLVASRVTEATEIAQLHVVSSRVTHLRCPIDALKCVEFVCVVVSADSSKIIYLRINLMTRLPGNAFRRKAGQIIRNASKITVLSARERADLQFGACVTRPPNP